MNHCAIKLVKPLPKIRRDGICVCTAEPEGRAGLYGFSTSTHYRFQQVSDGANSIWYRVFQEDGLYFEACNIGIFKQHFKPVS